MRIPFILCFLLITVFVFSQTKPSTTKTIPAIQNQLSGIKKELDKTEQRKQEAVTKLAASKNAVINYPTAVAAIEQIDKVADQYSFMNQTLDEGSSKIEQAGEAQYADVISYLKLIKANPDIIIPKPPTKEMSLCWSCNPLNQSKYNEEATEFNKVFLRNEKENFQKAVKFLQMVEKLRSLKETISPDLLKKEKEIETAINTILTRMLASTNALYKKYKDDFAAAQFIIPVVIDIQRQRALYTGDDIQSDVIDMFKELFQSYDKYFQKAVEDRNYSVLLDIKNIISMERQRELLGLSLGLNKLYDVIEKWNFFTLTTEVLVNKEEPTMLIHAISEKTFSAVLGDDGCSLILIPSDGDRTTSGDGDRTTRGSAQRLSWKLLNQKRLYSTPSGDIAQAKFEGDILISVKPTINLDLCGNKGNAVFKLVFDGSPEPKWIVPLDEFNKHMQKSVDEEFSMLLHNSFPKNYNDNSAADPMAFMALRNRFGRDEPIKNLDDMKKSYEFVKKFNTVSMLNDVYLLNFNVANNQKLLTDEKIYSPNKSEDESLKEAWIKIKLEHTPRN